MGFGLLAHSDSESFLNKTLKQDLTIIISPYSVRKNAANGMSGILQARRMSVYLRRHKRKYDRVREKYLNGILHATKLY